MSAPTVNSAPAAGADVGGAADATTLPADRRRAPGHAPVYASFRADLGPAGERCHDREAVLLAGFVALLARYSGQPTVTVSTSDGGAVGISAEGTFTDLLRAAAASGAAVRGARWGTPELGVRPVHRGRLAVDVDYDTGLFRAGTVHRLMRHYANLLDGGLTVPGMPVARLPLLHGDELTTVLVNWNDTRAAFPVGDGTVHGAFARQAALRPDAIAVVDGDVPMTFAAVDAAANRLAHRLRAGGVTRGTRVGTCLHRSADFLVAVLAVMKAGGAYVPLDPAYPPARLSTMVRDAHCVTVLTEAEPATALPFPMTAIDHSGDDDPGPPDGAVGPDDLCYVIYTSGSTGRPKGIALRHGGVLNNLLDLDTRYAVGPGDSVLALSSLSFDMSVYEFLGVTVAGATVIVPRPDRARNPSHWVELIAAHRVTVWNSAPALLELLVSQAERAGADLSSLRLALLGGDWIPVPLPDRLRAHAPALRFIALGGATEASIHSTLYEVGRVDLSWTSIPYGRPMANQRVYVLDSEMQPVPPGVAGELYLAGDGLARGYTGDPALTAARFVEWTYGPVTGERLYRTGDLVRFGADGLLELLGRMDFQVKVRGVRIETGEVEAAVRRHRSVRAVAVTANRNLVAYVVFHAGHHATCAELRATAAALLPASLVPARFVVLDALPLSPNGKVDRRALPDAPVSAPPAGPAHDEWETVVLDAWRAILGEAGINRDSDFYEVGGDSFAAMRIVQQIDPDLPVTELFEAHTVKALAARLRDRS